jgi:hypothetical protein
VQPRIEGLIIHPIQLAKGFAFVLDIPQASSRAPHQALDKRYYKRQNFQSVAMEDYEVRDILRRATTPDLQVDLSFGPHDKFLTQFAQGQEFSQTFFLTCTVRNKAPTPANYAIVEVMVDHDLPCPFALDPFVTVAIIDEPPRPKFRVFRRTISSPPGMPIFQEGVHDSHVAQIALQLPAGLAGSALIYLGTDIKAPGVSKQEEWAIRSKSGMLHLYRR